MNLIEKAERQIEADRARLRELEAENERLRAIIEKVRSAVVCPECADWAPSHEEWCDYEHEGRVNPSE